VVGELVIKSGVEGVSVEVSAEQILLLFRCQEFTNLHRAHPPSGPRVSHNILNISSLVITLAIPSKVSRVHTSTRGMLKKLVAIVLPPKPSDESPQLDKRSNSCCNTPWNYKVEVSPVESKALKIHIRIAFLYSEP
jgi:hypothetical protein